MSAVTGAERHPPGDGGRDLRLRIAGITVAVRSAAADLHLGLTGAARAFRAEGELADVALEAHWEDLSGWDGGELRFDSGGVWRLYRGASGYTFAFASPVFGPHPYKVAWLNDELTAGRIALHAGSFDRRAPVNPLEYPLDELLLTHLLARGLGVELHACGIVEAGGQGRLFVGQSGAGKTTTARLWQQATRAHVLSDDRIIVRGAGAAVRMHGTPWHGEAELSSTRAAPLRSIFLLRQAEANAIVPLRPAQLVARLFACSFPPPYSHGAVDRTVRTLTQLAADVEAYELRFVRDPSAVDLVRRTVGGGE